MSAEPSLAATEGAAPESSKSVELSLKQEAEREGVVPQRPAGTESLDEDALAALVTRDSMIGVARIEDGAH